MIIIVIIILNSQKHFCLLSHSTVSMWARLDDFFEVLTTPHPSFSSFLLLFPPFNNAIPKYLTIVSLFTRVLFPVLCFLFGEFNWPDSKLNRGLGAP